MDDTTAATTNRNALFLPDTRRTLGLIDAEYTSLGCLGAGGHGSVYLARKRSGRKVALKVMPMDTSDDEDYRTFLRELEAVHELNQGDDADGKHRNNNRDLHIVFFEDWFISRNFVCIVMQYADGGTLSDEIERRMLRTPAEPYAERRIAWYALQLCDALAFAHEKGVAHHDVKSSNILIDASAGGRLLLADFGTALKPGEETVGFTRSYASPELLASHELEDFSNLRPDSIDAFALGAVIYELLACKRLEDLSADQTLAQFITDGPGLEAVLTMDRTMALPWLPPNVDPGGSPYVGYTNGLKSLVSCFLNPNANERLLPGQVREHLRGDPSSPLLLPHVAAARTANAGDAVTIDNVQLGMLVQRGRDWTDGDDDGGPDSTGVVVKLDGDGTYADVAFPARTGRPIETLCCRIGASNKFELQVGPCGLRDYVSGEGVRTDGILWVGKEAAFGIAAGHMPNQNCMVVGVDEPLGMAFVAPMERMRVPALPKKAIWGMTGGSSSFVSTDGEEACPPSSWQLDLGPLINVLNTAEGSEVLELFYNGSGGLKRRNCPVKSIQRVQDTWLWGCYAQRRQRVSNENWGIENEIMAFMATPDELDASNLRAFRSSGNQFSAKSSVVHYKFKRSQGKSLATLSQMLLCRIAVGRVLNEAGKGTTRNGTPAATKCHSEAVGEDAFACLEGCAAYPEYIISYADESAPPSHAATNAHKSPVKPVCRSESKMCVVCLERSVRYVTVPCGHPCLCEKCNGSQIRKKLRGKCPECRASFHTTTIIYGRVVIDD